MPIPVAENIRKSLRRSNGRYITKDGKPVPEPDLMKWAMWLEEGTNRRVAYTRVHGVEVSTIFLGLDHNYSRRGKPILWETMILGGKYKYYQRRYSSLADAKAGHRRAVEKVKNAFRAELVVTA